MWVAGDQHRDFSRMERLSPDVCGLVLRESEDIGAYGNCHTYCLGKSHLMARLAFYDNFYLLFLFILYIQR